MKKIMFNDKYGLTKAVLEGRKTMTRRIVKGEIPLGNWAETEKYAPYQVGEVVAIAQCYNQIGLSPLMYCEVPNEYCGTRDGSFYELAGWTNKMFVKAELMPHHIKITNIKVEHLQDISDDDCIKEGVKQYICTFGITKECNGIPVFEETYRFPQEAFASIINGVSGIGTWQSNPLVWVYEFELVD